jgi:hypothetical protein
MSFIRRGNRATAIASVVGLLFLSTIAAAQGPGRRGLGGPGGFTGGPGFGGPGFGFGGGRVVTNAPYSGVGVSTFANTLSNGNVINRSNCTKVYRDSAGRTRQEETPNSSTCSATPRTIVIRDTVAGVQYVIDEQNNTYRQFTIKAPPLPPQTGLSPNLPVPPNGGQVQTTNLGTQPIPGTGFSAQGTQTVRTIPAGEIGNAQPIIITSITWYSPDLQIVVQSSRDDPRAGKTSYQLSNISTANPDESLFQLPAGLTQQQGPGGHPRPVRQ